MNFKKEFFLFLHFFFSLTLSLFAVVFILLSTMFIFNEISIYSITYVFSLYSLFVLLGYKYNKKAHKTYTENIFIIFHFASAFAFMPVIANYIKKYFRNVFCNEVDVTINNKPHKIKINIFGDEFSFYEDKIHREDFQPSVIIKSPFREYSYYKGTFVKEGIMDKNDIKKHKTNNNLENF